jgi:c-di-GMP-binding flagellar brake protein YcgR
MSYLAERRKYKRCDSIVCKALMSVDESRWDNVELNDISAGGLSFYSSYKFEEKSRLFFNLYVYNMLSEFNIRLEGRVVRIDRNRGRNVYAVKFENINKYQQVQLDELVKSKVTVRNALEHVVHEEEYSIFLFPRFRPKAHKMRIRNYK